MREIDVADLKDIGSKLKAGERVLLSGTVYTARDAAHKRMFELLDRGEALPMDIENAVIYYAGPTPAPENKPIGSCGPTTSARMNNFAPRLLDLGLIGIIGKGEMGKEVAEGLKKGGGVYFGAVGGAGALIAKSVVECEEIGFFDLGCESIKRLKLDKLPLTVCMDANGGNIFEEEIPKYRA